jgi:hypothetical protein
MVAAHEVGGAGPSMSDSRGLAAHAARTDAGGTREGKRQMGYETSRAGRRPPPARRARSAIIAVIGVLLAVTVAAPVTAGSPSRHGLADATTRDFHDHSAGRPVRINAKVAARAAADAPRKAKALGRLKVPFAAGHAAAPTKAGSLNLANPGTGASRLSIGPRIVIPQPTPVVTTSFPGLNHAEACGSCEPPDPWIAVSASYVVQTTNGAVRITNRAGAPLATVPSWALFAVPADRYDSDPRILWDGVHGRWVGVLTTFNGDFSQNGLRLAVSESADPTAGWLIYPIETGPYLADYPGISSSSDKIVLTSDDFLSLSFAGPSFFVMDWSNILAGTDLYIGGTSYNTPNFGHFRPAIMLSAGATVPVIYENLDQPWYFEIAGSAHTAAATNEFDLTSNFGASVFTLPPSPTQPDLSSISNAVDERPTDAVYRNGQVWFVNTFDYFDTLNHWAAARYSLVLTSVNGTAISFGGEIPAATSGVHYFMPGVGINADGSAFLSATMTDETSTYPTTVVGAYLAGSGISPYQVIEASDHAYAGTRWGDFVGIAADPAGAGAVWLSHELVAADGSWRTSVVRIVSDGTVPSASGALGQASVPPATLGATIPVRISWGASTDVDSGVKGYLVARSVDNGAYDAPAVLVPGTSTVRSLLVGHTYRFRITAVDAVGNQSLPVYGPIFRPTLYQQTSGTVYTGTWSTSSSTSFSGGSARYTSVAGRYATFTATNARSIGIVVPKSSNRGSFKVYVDGVYKATVSEYSATYKYRQLVYQYAWSAPGTHKIKILVKGTSGHPRVDLDAFVVLR